MANSLMLENETAGDILFQNCNWRVKLRVDTETLFFFFLLKEGRNLRQRIMSRHLNEFQTGYF